MSNGMAKALATASIWIGLAAITFLLRSTPEFANHVSNVIGAGATATVLIWIFR